MASSLIRNPKIFSQAMKEDLNPNLYKFLICKLGLDSLRNSTFKTNIFPWIVNTKSSCNSNNLWKWKPDKQKLMRSKSFEKITEYNNISLPSSPCHVYFDRRDALNKSERFEKLSAPLIMCISEYGSMLQGGIASVKISYDFDFQFIDNENIRDSNYISKNGCGPKELDYKHSCKDQFDGRSTSKLTSKNCQKSIYSCLLEQDFAPLKDIKQFHATNRPSLVNEVSNEDEDEYWKTFNFMTPRGGGAGTNFSDQGKEVTIMLDNHVGHHQESPNNKSSNVIKDHTHIDKIHASLLQLPNSDENIYISDHDVVEESFKDIEINKNYIPLEKCGSEVDDLCVEDVEGESVIDKLRRQAEFYQKTIIKLYEEIDKERNAAAEAASQAMAMITKLQEEKALIDLDALQCLRMMEEDAKHDSSALEKAYDLLDQKDTHIQDLEARLNFYRTNYPCEYKKEQTQFQTPHLGMASEEVKDLEGFNTKDTSLDTLEL